MADKIVVPSNEEINKMNKDVMKAALLKLIGDIQERQNNSKKLDEILEMMRKRDNEVEGLTSRVDNLEKENKDLRETVNQQQRFMEMLDAEKRACNLIVMGVPESPKTLTVEGESAKTDNEKVKMVFKKVVDDDLDIQSITRLGALDASDPEKCRPTKIVLASPAPRKDILDNTKKLKAAGDTFKKIFIKKDVHPFVRKELGRLRDATKREKDRAENAGKEVVYDHNTRTLTVDGIVVDRYKPCFFQ